MKLRYPFVAAAIVLPMTLYAAETTTSESLFKSLDKDNNGMITQTEAKRHKRISSEWGQIDKNKDGNISLSELTSYHPAEAFEPVEEENEPIGAAPTD